MHRFFTRNKEVPSKVLKNIAIDAYAQTRSNLLLSTSSERMEHSLKIANALLSEYIKHIKSTDIAKIRNCSFRDNTIYFSRQYSLYTDRMNYIYFYKKNVKHRKQRLKHYDKIIKQAKHNLDKESALYNDFLELAVYKEAAKDYLEKEKENEYK